MLLKRSVVVHGHSYFLLSIGKCIALCAPCQLSFSMRAIRHYALATVCSLVVMDSLNVL